MSTTYTCRKGHQYVAPTARLGEQAKCPTCEPDRVTYPFPTTPAQRDALDDLRHGDSLLAEPTALSDGRLLITTETGVGTIDPDGTMRDVDEETAAERARRLGIPETPGEDGESIVAPGMRARP